MPLLQINAARTQFMDANGEPLTGGSVTTYVPGTTTPLTTYQDPNAAAQNDNPVTLDSLGSAAFWANRLVRMIVRDADGNQLYDQVGGGLNPNSIPDTIINAATYGMFTGNTEAQNLIALNAWIAAINAADGNGNSIVATIPPGVYRVNATATAISASNLTLMLWGVTFHKTASCTGLRIYKNPNISAGARVEHVSVFGFCTTADDALAKNANGTGLDLTNVAFGLVFGGLHQRATLGLNIATYQEIHVGGKIEFIYCQDGISHNFGDSLFIDGVYIKGAVDAASVTSGVRGIVSLDGGGVTISRTDIILCDFGHHLNPGDTRGGAAPGAYVAIVTWGDGCYIDSCNYGVVAQPVVASHGILPELVFTSGCRIASHVVNGIIAYSARALKISCSVRDCGNDGVVLIGCNDIHVVNATICCNNSANIANGSGLSVQGADLLHVVCSDINNDPAFKGYQGDPDGENHFQYHAVNIDQYCLDVLIQGVNFGRGHLGSRIYRPSSNDATQTFIVRDNMPSLVAGNSPDNFASLSLGSGSNDIAAGQTRYLTSGGAVTNIDALPFMFEQSALVTGFRVEVGTAPGVGQTLTFQAMLNGSAISGMSGTITGAATTLEVTASTTLMSKPNRLTLQVIASAGAATTTVRGDFKTQG